MSIRSCKKCFGVMLMQRGNHRMIVINLYSLTMCSMFS